MIHWIEAIAFASSLVFAILLALYPRFGPGSRFLLFLILPVCLSAGIQVCEPGIFNLSPGNAYKISFALIILAAGGGYHACCALNQRAKHILVISTYILSVSLVSLLYLVRLPAVDSIQPPRGFIPLGPVGYASALFLLQLSIIVLANLEQILRKSSEAAKWELKFLFLGIGLLYATIIYMATQTLLFPPRSGFLFTGSTRLFHATIPISCILSAISWKRSSGKIQIAISHGAIYSTITFLSIGVYLIASSVIARLASRWGDVGLPVEALIFLLSAVILAAFFLGTAFRQRARAWIRRNIFAGRYDYRQFWLEATERIRSTDPPATMAKALADIVHKALGAIDVSVWIRYWNPNRFHLLCFLGNISNSPKPDISGVVEPIIEVLEPISLEDLDGRQGEFAIKEFMLSMQASLLVPLLSSNRIVGVITVGADRSGRPYDSEAREFLRALSSHAAGEFHKWDLLETLVEAKADEAFRSFSTFVMHDLKNFASTLSYIAQNAPHHQHNPEFQRDAFQSVYNTAEKMKSLCNSLRTFSGALAANKKLTDLNQVVRSVADTFNAGSQQHLKLEIKEIALVMANADEIGRVLQNLLINAREATPMDGVIAIRTANHREKVEIIVEDNGRGMNREFFEKELFVPFHTTKSGGLGIGLFQSKKIMDAHHGSIIVESEEEKGTRVTLSFPVSRKMPQTAIE